MPTQRPRSRVDNRRDLHSLIPNFTPNQHATAGTPVLAAPVPNYELVVDGNLLKLNSLGGLSPYETRAGAFHD